MTVLMSGINMYAMAVVMKVVLGWDIHFSIWVSSITVAVYVGLGGLLSAIFNEVLQFVLIWLGALLVSILGLIEAGGWSGMVARIHTNFPGAGLHPPVGTWARSGQSHGHHTGWASCSAWARCISMGYWTTDFLVVQRVLSAKDLRSAKTGAHHRRGFQDVRAVHRDPAGLLGLAVLESGPSSWWAKMP